MFLGDDWSTNDPSPQLLISQIRDMLNGPLITELNQYGVMTGTLFPAVDIIGNAASGVPFPIDIDTGKQYITDDALAGFVVGEIGAGRVPAPSPLVDRIYFIMLPNTVSSLYSTKTDLSQARGAHEAASYNGTPFYFAFALNRFIPPNELLAAGGSGVFSHEFVEAATDPDTKTGWHLPATLDGREVQAEIADVCCNSYVSLHNTIYAQNLYWSQQQGKCVMPSSWDSIWGYTGTGTTWIPVAAAPSHLIVSGTYGVALADNYNDVWVAPAGQPWIRTTSISPTMLAVTAESAYALNYRTARIYRFDGVSGWLDIGLPSTTAPTMTGIYGGDFGLFATDSSGNAYQYDPARGTWTLVRSQISQIAVSKRGVYMLSADHLTLAFTSTPYSYGAFSTVGANVGEMFAAPGGIAVTDLSTRWVMWRNEVAGTWTWQGAAEYMFAATGDPGSPQLFGLLPDRSAVIESGSLAQTFPIWNLVGPRAGLLIGGGQFLYAPANIIYNNANGGDLGPF